MHRTLLPIAVAAASVAIGANAAADLPTVVEADWAIAGTVLLGTACGGVGGGCFKNANGKLNFLFTVPTQPDCIDPALTLTEWRPVYPLDGIAMIGEAIAAEAALVADAAKTPIAHVVLVYGPAAVTAAATDLAAWGTAAGGVTFSALTNCGPAGLLYAMMDDVQASAARTNPAFKMVMPVPNKMKLLRSFEEFGANGAALSVQSSGLDITLAGGAGTLAEAATRIETSLAATKGRNPSMTVTAVEATKQVVVKGIKPTDLLTAAAAASAEREISVIRPSRSFDTSEVPQNDGSIGVIIGATVAALAVVGGAFMYGHRRKHQMLDQYKNQYEEHQRASKAQGKGGPGQQGGGRGGGPPQRQTQGGQTRPQGRPGQGQGRPGQSMRPGGGPPPQSVRGGNGGGGRGGGRGPPRKMPSAMSSGGMSGTSSGKRSKASGNSGSGRKLSL